MRSASEINRAVEWTASEEPQLDRHSLYRKVDRLVASRAIGSILELGCGSGRYLEVLRRRGWHVKGVELQAQAADFVQQGNLEEPLPFGPEFDIVLAVEVVEHLVDTESFLHNCASVLKPGGILILTTPNLLFGVNRIRMLLGRRPLFAYADYHVRMFVWDDLLAKLRRDFQVKRLLGSHILLGSRAGILRGTFSWLADRRPTLAAHLIVQAEKKSDAT